MVKQESDIKLKRVKLHIKNAPVDVASGITHQLYRMLDDKELHSISIEDVRKSEHSIEILIVIGVFLGGYTISKILDVPVNHALAKILGNLRIWKHNRKQTKLDFFIDDKHLE